MRVVLGCGNFGGIGSAPAFFGKGETKEEAFELMDAAWELGLRRFDTADAYGGGRSEQWIGDWMRATGKRPQITSKTFNAMEDGGDFGLARERVLRQAATSQERLGIDRIDLYLTHEPDPGTPVEETFATFEALAERGLIAAWGVSNVGGDDLREWLSFGKPLLVQNSYSLLERGNEADVIPLCAEHGIEYQAFSPLAGGWLTGKYSRHAPPPAGSRMTLRPQPYEHLRTGAVYDALEGLERLGDPATLALAWLLAQPDVTAVVVGPRRPEQLRPALAALDATIDADAVGALFAPSGSASDL